MKITSVEAIPLCIGFNKRHKNTSIHEGTGMLTGIGYILVKIHTDEGIIGIGEVGRFFEGETQESVAASILRIFGPAIVGADPMNISRIHRLMDNQVNEIHWAKSGIDMAIYDLMGKALNLPVYMLLGGHHRTVIPQCPTLFMKADYQQTVEDCVYYAEQGFRTLKIKIGDDPAVDLELVRRVRERLGDSIAIRVDANQGYSSAQAVPVLTKMETYNLMLVEQPCPKWDINGMRRVRQALHTPVFSCEGVRTAQDALHYVRSDAIDGINLKLGRPGGFYGAMKVVAVAEAAGLPIAVGTMMELGVGTSAALHLAAALRELPYPSDTYGTLHLEADIITEPICYRDGALIVPEGPGLGVELDEDKIRRYRVSI